jgi:hypothetical protein
MEADRIKHLELIQALVTRMESNSFLLKGWSLTSSAALFGFALEGTAPGLALAGMGASLALGTLDAFYLRRERLFRRLYEAVRTRDARVGEFSMDTSTFADEVETGVQTFLAPTVLGVQGLTTIAGLIVLGFILRLTS